MTTDSGFCTLDDAALIAFSGDDAVAFLHAQLTSDVAGLAALTTQYSGYCSPKGRLLATFLVWKLEDEILLQLPAALRESVQSRLARYVLRAKVKVADASQRYTLFGAFGADALAVLTDRAPAAPHAIVCAGDLRIVRVPIDRFMILAPADGAEHVRARIGAALQARDAAVWRGLDVEAGIPVITTASQEQYVPQMVNLDLVGGVSYSKGCYPGQEIVARTHYLGRLKQRMYRIRVSGASGVETSQPLYSPEFADQACGAILSPGRPSAGGVEALAVIQKSSAESGSVRLGEPGGAPVELLPLPYTLPE